MEASRQVFLRSGSSHVYNSRSPTFHTCLSLAYLLTLSRQVFHICLEEGSCIYAFSVANVRSGIWCLSHVVSGFHSAITILRRCQVCLSHLHPVWRGNRIMGYGVCLFNIGEIKQTLINLSVISYGGADILYGAFRMVG